MKKQVLIIHGGTTFPTYKDYVDSLKSVQIDLSRLKYQLDWKNSITSDLGNKYEVFVPKMPNSTDAKYNEWKMWFEKIILLLNDDVILIGHSLGGIFLAKYLSENTICKKTKAVILIAAPFKDTNIEKLSSFSLPKSILKIGEQINKIILIQSEDDPLVPIEHIHLFKKQLPSAKIVLFKNNGHFKQEHFPELVSLIKSL